MLMNKLPLIGPGLALCLLASAAAAPVPQMPPREGVIVLSYTQDGPPAEILTPSGRAVGKVASGAAKRPFSWPQAECPLLNPRLSADAKRILAVRGGFAGDPHEVWLFDLNSEAGPSEPILTDLQSATVIWSRDGTKLYGSSLDKGKEADPIPKDGPDPKTCWTFDLKTRKRAPLAIPPGHEIVDLSPDGKTLLTKCLIRHNDTEKRNVMAAFLVPLDTLKPKQLAQTPFLGMRFSPDGTRVLGCARDLKQVESVKWKPAVCSTADGSLQFVRIGEEVVDFFYACWSPDGKRIAMVWKEKVPTPKGVNAGRQWHAMRVTVCDPGGGNADVIARRKFTQTISGVDWK